MTPRRQRMWAVGLVVAGVALAAGFALKALDEQANHFYSTSQVSAGEAPGNRTIRLGGMVRDGTFERETGTISVQFVLTDYASDVRVHYTGLLPDLFREGQGIIAHGQLADDGSFQASKVLAKHDESYMPPEVTEALEAAKGNGAGEST